MKHNLFRVKILDIKFQHSGDSTNVKTTCIIKWINPSTGQNCTTKASTRKNPNDENNFVLAMRIAESRAKIAMWHKYIDSLAVITVKVFTKHEMLINIETKRIIETIKLINK